MSVSRAICLLAHLLSTMSYFHDIKTGILTTIKGLSLTLQALRNATKRRTPEGIASDSYFDLQNGLVTLQYPTNNCQFLTTDVIGSAMKLKIVSFVTNAPKFARSTALLSMPLKRRRRLVGLRTVRRFDYMQPTLTSIWPSAATVALCTVVCPTECLTMDKKFDYSEFELGKLTYEFSNLT